MSAPSSTAASNAGRVFSVAPVLWTPRCAITSGLADIAATLSAAEAVHRELSARLRMCSGPVQNLATNRNRTVTTCLYKLRSFPANRRVWAEAPTRADVA